MKYFSFILSLIIIVSIKSSTDNIIILDIDKKDTITLSLDTYYIKTSLSGKSGNILINIHTPKDQDNKIDFSYRIASSLEDDVEKSAFQSVSSTTTTESNSYVDYSVIYRVESKDKVGILKMTNLKNKQVATISASFYSDKTIIIYIIVIVVVLLLIIIGVVICICKGLLRCCCHK